MIVPPTGTYAGTGAVGSTQRLMQKLHEAIYDANIVISTDSTGAHPFCWPYRTLQALAASFPAWTVLYKQWSQTGGHTYDPANDVTIQTGTNGRTLTLWNCAVPGKNLWFWQAPDLKAMLVDPAPDLVIVATGHNEDTGMSSTNHLFRGKYAAFTGRLRQVLPDTPIICLAQNPAVVSKLPTVINYDQVLRRDEIRALCAAQGLGFIDACQAFLDQPDIGPLLIDTVHPTGGSLNGNATDGQALIVAEVAKAFVRDPHANPRPQQPSPFDTAAAVNLAGPLTMLSGDTSVIGWTAANATVARDTAKSDTNLGYSVHLAQVASGTASRIFSQVLDSTSILPWRGKWLTVVARCYRATAERYAGLMSVAVAGGLSGTTLTDDFSSGDWIDRIVPIYIDPAATGLTVSLWCHQQDGLSETGDVWWSPGLFIIPGAWPSGRGLFDIVRLLPPLQVQNLVVGDPNQSGAVRELKSKQNTDREDVIRTGTTRRFSRRYTNNETGSNNGSDELLLAYDDTGTLLGTWYTLRRKDGRLTWGGAAIVPPVVATASLPSASGMGAGAQVYDSTILRPKVSDGSAWQQVPISTDTMTPAAHQLRSPGTHIDALRRTGALAETFDRRMARTAATITTAALWLYAIELDSGMTISNITFMSGGTPGSGMTHQWFALYSGALALRAVTADDTSTAWVANAEKTLALTAPYVTTASGLHYVGVCVVGTPPTLKCVDTDSFVAQLAPVSGGRSTGSLTDPASAPSTASGITGDKAVWSWLS